MRNAIPFALCLIFFSCSDKQEANKTTASLPRWLIGTWISDIDSTRFVESWEMINDSLFKGKGMGLKGTDTLFSEELEMKIINGSAYYIPTVAEQNDGNAVQFQLTESDSSGFVAENKRHDFPKRIEYQLKNDSIYAILTGIENGRERREVFPMKKE